ncbi:MAG: hypothetical protein LBB77_05215 [Treponema sp.]|jgi:hypothetical protein|nr:hypothetical protein [Treponema sp.]
MEALFPLGAPFSMSSIDFRIFITQFPLVCFMESDLNTSEKNNEQLKSNISGLKLIVQEKKSLKVSLVVSIPLAVLAGSPAAALPMRK